ncbi:MAG: CCA tRNA nucleotidyltransferase [Acidimicrobiia bacterium]
MSVPPRLAALLAPEAPVQRVARVLVDAGHECYLVGGSVRDALIGDLPVEFDFASSARPDELERLLAPIADHVWLQGKRFGTVGAQVDGVPCEITTFRAEVYRPDSRKPEVSFGDSIETDLSRRDFTVNALALRLPDAVLVDPFDGATDLAAGRLRTPLAPEVSFTDDPLRMMRAARFVARFGFTPDPELVAAVEELRNRLDIVSAERVRDELSKLLLVEDPSPGLWFLASTGLSDRFLPELNAMELEQDPIHHHKDVLAHTIAVVAKTSPELVLRLAALMHDVGKPKTRSFERGRATFHHHEVVGARITRDRLTALRYPTEVVDDVTQLVYLHLRIHTYAMGWTDAAVRRYVRDAGHLLERLNELQRCDCTTRNERKARTLGRRMDELEERIDALAAQEELRAIKPPLDGKQVMEFLGIPPGPVVGEALAFLLEARLDEGPIDEADAYARLRAWFDARSD